MRLMPLRGPAHEIALLLRGVGRASLLDTLGCLRRTRSDEFLSNVADGVDVAFSYVLGDAYGR